MNLRAATDMISPMPKQYFSEMRRTALVLCLLVVVAFIATITLVRHRNSVADGLSNEAPATIAVAPARAERPIATAHAADSTDRRQPENPAAQKAGPPDPEARRLAAASAENAARAAAELAGSMPSPGN